MVERWGKLFTLQSPDFPDKVIHDPDFLHLLAVHLLDLADQDFADKPVQYGLVQFLNGGIAPAFLDKRFGLRLSCVSARLCITARSCRRFWLASCSCSSAAVSFINRCSDRTPLPYRCTGLKTFRQFPDSGPSSRFASFSVWEASTRYPGAPFGC